MWSNSCSWVQEISTPAKYCIEVLYLLFHLIFIIDYEVHSMKLVLQMKELRYKRINSTKVTCLLRLIPSSPRSSAWEPSSVRHWSPHSIHHTMMPPPWDHILPKGQKSLRKWGVGEGGDPRTPCTGWAQGRQGPQLWQPLNNCSNWSLTW